MTGDSEHRKGFYINQHRKFIILSLLGGVYQPDINKIFKSKRHQKLLSIWAAFAIICITSLSVSCLVHLIFVGEILNDIVMDMMVLTSALQAMGCVCWYYWKRKHYADLIQFWDSEFEDDDDGDERLTITNLHYSKMNKYLKVLTAITFIALNGWAFSEYFDEEKELSIPSPIPYRRQWPDFEILLTATLVPCLIHPFTVHTMQVMTILPIIWEIAALERLKARLSAYMVQMSNIINKLEEYSYKGISAQDGMRLDACIPKLTAEEHMKKEFEYVNQQLKSWIKEHQFLIEFHLKAHSLAKWPVSAKMFSTFMAAWLSALNGVRVEVPIRDKVANILFFVPYVLMFKELCNYCDLLLSTSQSLFDEAFTKNWNILPLETQRNLLIIVRQANRPFVYKGFNLIMTNNRTFSAIMRSAYSVFNFLFASLNKT